MLLLLSLSHWRISCMRWKAQSKNEASGNASWSTWCKGVQSSDKAMVHGPPWHPKKFLLGMRVFSSHRPAEMVDCVSSDVMMTPRGSPLSTEWQSNTNIFRFLSSQLQNELINNTSPLSAMRVCTRFMSGVQTATTTWPSSVVCTAALFSLCSELCLSICCRMSWRILSHEGTWYAFWKISKYSLHRRLQNVKTTIWPEIVFTANVVNQPRHVSSWSKKFRSWWVKFVCSSAVLFYLLEIFTLSTL